MAIFKCKMCGGSLGVTEGDTIISCEYCGTKQTLPKLTDEKREKLYDRANHFRRSNDFDKAMEIYEQILEEDGTDAEAYWSLVLCQYGIEYVEDPATGRRVPTVNRAQFTSVFDDVNYKSAIEHADIDQRILYESEAKAINEIQKGILAISQNEEPFDIFICYKETDDNGRRTRDSVLAQDLYYQLKQEDFKVFFARITLEDKLGSAYEPYIFAALNSAKVMVVLGTRPEFFNAVWVRNEWSRYLSLIKRGEKKMLIPAYRDMNPYDLPQEFSHLQAQDMSKLGFMQDLIRGIKKIVPKTEPVEAPAAAPVATIVTATGNSSALLRRAAMFLEEGEFDNAHNYCERVLDMDPENPQAYVLELMAQLNVKTENKLGSGMRPLDEFPAYRNAVRFADNDLKERLLAYNATINDRIEKKIQDDRRRYEEEQKRRREQEEKRARERRINQGLDALRRKRDDIDAELMTSKRRLESLSKDIQKKRKEMDYLADPKKVRIVGIIGIISWFVMAVLFFSAMEDDSTIAPWIIFTVIFYIIFAIFAKTTKRSIGWAFVNIPTFGIYGIIDLVVRIAKAGSLRGQWESQIRQLAIQANAVSEHIEALEVSLAEAKAEIDRYTAEHYGGNRSNG